MTVACLGYVPRSFFGAGDKGFLGQPRQGSQVLMSGDLRQIQRVIMNHLKAGGRDVPQILEGQVGPILDNAARCPPTGRHRG